METEIIAAIITASCGVLAAIITAIITKTRKNRSRPNNNLSVKQEISGNNNNVIGIINNAEEENDDE